MKPGAGFWQPRSEFRQVAALTYIYWYLVYGGYVVTELIAWRFRFIRDAPVDIVAVGLVGTAALALFPVVRHTTGKPIAYRLALLVPAGIAVAGAQIGINYGENLILGTITNMAVEEVRDRYARLLLYRLYLELGYVSMAVLILEARRSADDRVARAQAEAHAERARSAALRFQLNPHFLFNSLNAISSLIVTHRPEAAERMLEELSQFLRISLAADPEQPVTLDQELETVEAYLAIEAVRFGDRLQIAIDCPDELHDVLVPAFVLQPLVENAVRHGVAQSRRAVTICIAAVAQDGALILSVTDDGEGLDAAEPAKGLGIGTENVRARLKTLYGSAGRFDAGRGEDGRWRAIVRMPVQRALRNAA